MFSSYARLTKKNGNNPAGRKLYIEKLLYELNTTSDKDAEIQILSNISNLCYDPINYDYFKSFGAIEMLMERLKNFEDNTDYIPALTDTMINCIHDPECFAIISENIQVFINIMKSGENLSYIDKLVAVVYYICEDETIKNRLNFSDFNILKSYLNDQTPKHKLNMISLLLERLNLSL